MIQSGKQRKEAVALRNPYGGIRTPQLIAGILTILLAVALTCGTMLLVRQCTDPLAAATKPSTTIPHPTAPSPTLAPNPYGPEDFVFADNYLTCLTGESWLGVDVSEHQGQIDWEAVADTRVRFAMVRMAFRGWGSEGALRADALGYDNLNGARAAGLQVGVYVFSQAISVEEAVEEAQFVLQLLDGQALDLPIVFDWETVSSEDARTADMDIDTLNACAQAFCQQIEAAGYEAMVYFNLDLAKRMLHLLDLQEAGYDFWLAMYSQTLNYAYQVRMWQYTSSGTVDGIRGKVDLNLYFPEI